MELCRLRNNVRACAEMNLAIAGFAGQPQGVEASRHA